MITFQNDPSARLLKLYPPPFEGTWKTLPAYLLPDTVLQDSLNVTLLSGKLRSRLGLSLYSDFNLNTSAKGSFLFVNTLNQKIPVVSTSNKVYKYLLGSWQDITGVTSLQSASQVRMTSIQLGTSIYLLYANGLDLLKVSTDLNPLSSITPYIDPILGASSIPILTDISTSFNRIIGVQPPYTVTWCSAITSSYLNFTNWPAANQVVLSDTEDAIVCCGSLGTLGLAIYKEGNIFLGIAQQGVDSAAFRFEHRGQYEGPAGVQARVSAYGGHVYMTNTGRIAFFDGTQHKWVADGLWPFLQDDIDLTYAKNIFGVYNYKTSEIYFWYPKVGDNGLLKGMVILNGPYPTAGVTTVSYFLGRSNFECTNGLSVPLFNSSADPLVFGVNNGNKTYSLRTDTYTDEVSSFPCSLSTGVFSPTPEELPMVRQKGLPSSIYRPILQGLLSRDTTRGTVNVSALVSQNMYNDGTPTTAETIDLTETPINEYIGFNDSGEFLGVKMTWDSTSQVEYKGCQVYGRTAT